MPDDWRRHACYRYDDIRSSFFGPVYQAADYISEIHLQGYLINLDETFDRPGERWPSVDGSGINDPLSRRDLFKLEHQSNPDD